MLASSKAHSFLTFISESCMTSGKTSMQLEWAITVCIRLQFMMVVGMAFSLFPLMSISSNSSSLAILLWKQEFKNFSFKRHIFDFEAVIRAMGFVTLREQITDFDSCSQQCLSALLMSDANTVVEQNGYFFCQRLLMLPFKLLILLASPLLTSSLSSFPPFFPFLSNLVSRYTSPSPIFTSPILAPHSALPPKFISVPFPCCWSPAAQNITQGQGCLFHYLLASLFQGCTPSVLQHILHLKDFWLKQSELKSTNCCQGRISFWSWEDFSLVEFCPLPETFPDAVVTNLLWEEAHQV